MPYSGLTNLGRRRQLALQFQMTSSWMDRQRDATEVYEAALQEAHRKGRTPAQGLTSGLERATFSTGTLTEQIAELGDELARVLYRMFVLEPLAQARGAGISGFFAPGPPSGPATGPGDLAVGGGVTSQLHQGGVVGRDGAPRLVDPAVFIGARMPCGRLSHRLARPIHDFLQAILTRSASRAKPRGTV